MRKVITGKGVNVRKYAETVEGIKFPENTLDINEQANFMSTLDVDGDIITFSPWIISDSKEEQVFTVNDDLTLSPVDMNTYGASVNKISMNILGRNTTIGDLSKQTIADFNSRMAELSFNEVDKVLGESVEKILLTKVMLDMDRNK